MSQYEKSLASQSHSIQRADTRTAVEGPPEVRWPPDEMPPDGMQVSPRSPRQDRPAIPGSRSSLPPPITWDPASGLALQNGTEEWRSVVVVGATGWPVVEDLLLALGLFEDYPWVICSGPKTIIVFRSSGYIGTPFEFFRPQDNDSSYRSVELRWSRKPTPLPSKILRGGRPFPSEPPRELDRFEIAGALTAFTGDSAPLIDRALDVQSYEAAWNGDLSVIGSALAHIQRQAGSESLPSGLERRLAEGVRRSLPSNEASVLVQEYLPQTTGIETNSSEVRGATPPTIGTVFIGAELLGWSPPWSGRAKS